MIAFLLGLLKIIGIILLVLLGLLLLIVGIVLFVPIRYRGAGQLSEEAKTANGQVTWLLKAIRLKVDYSYPDKPIISLKVLWVDVLKLLDKRKNKKSSSGSGEPESVPDSDERAKQPETNSLAPKAPKQSVPDSESSEALLQDEEAQLAPVKEKETLKEKFENIIFKIRAVYDKIKNIIYNIQYYITVLQEEDTKQLIAHAWDAILKILKSIRPRVFQLEGEFGFATPDTTGQVYGYYCMLMPTIGEHVRLVPNFEEKVLQGKLYLKGRITVFVILINVLRIVFDKRLQPLINKLKNGGKQNGR